MYQIDNQSRIAVYEQIVAQIESYVIAGVLPSGAKLPSVRGMSVELGANPNTVQRAYTKLEDGGIVVTSPGRGAYIVDGAADILRQKRIDTDKRAYSAITQRLSSMGVEKSALLDIVENFYKGDNQND